MEVSAIEVRRMAIVVNTRVVVSIPNVSAMDNKMSMVEIISFGFTRFTSLQYLVFGDT